MLIFYTGECVGAISGSLWYSIRGSWPAATASVDMMEDTLPRKNSRGTRTAGWAMGKDMISGETSFDCFSLRLLFLLFLSEWAALDELEQSGCLELLK